MKIEDWKDTWLGQIYLGLVLPLLIMAGGFVVVTGVLFVLYLMFAGTIN